MNLLRLPLRHGFASWFGLPFSHDMRLALPRDKGFQTRAYYDPKPEYWDVPLMRNDEVVERPVDHRTLTKRYTEEAARFIAESRASDPGEHFDLAAKHADVIADLVATAAAHRRTIEPAQPLFDALLPGSPGGE